MVTIFLAQGFEEMEALERPLASGQAYLPFILD